MPPHYCWLIKKQISCFSLCLAILNRYLFSHRFNVTTHWINMFHSYRKHLSGSGQSSSLNKNCDFWIKETYVKLRKTLHYMSFLPIHCIQQKLMTFILLPHTDNVPQMQFILKIATVIKMIQMTKAWPELTSVYATESRKLCMQSSTTTSVISLHYIQKTSSVNKQSVWISSNTIFS